MIHAPISAIDAPIISYLSDLNPSTFHAQSRARTINTPPKVAYTGQRQDVYAMYLLDMHHSMFQNARFIHALRIKQQGPS